MRDAKNKEAKNEYLKKYLDMANYVRKFIDNGDGSIKRSGRKWDGLKNNLHLKKGIG